MCAPIARRFIATTLRWRLTKRARRNANSTTSSSDFAGPHSRSVLRYGSIGPNILRAGVMRRSGQAILGVGLAASGPPSKCAAPSLKLRLDVSAVMSVPPKILEVFCVAEGRPHPKKWKKAQQRSAPAHSYFHNSSGSLAMLAAMLRASRMSRFAVARRPGFLAAIVVAVYSGPDVFSRCRSEGVRLSRARRRRLVCCSMPKTVPPAGDTRPLGLGQEPSRKGLGVHRPRSTLNKNRRFVIVFDVKLNPKPGVDLCQMEEVLLGLSSKTSTRLRLQSTICRFQSMTSPTRLVVS
jgi:hypothetical protein